MNARICAFADCDAAILQLRHAVFVDEQGVPEELEVDGLDPGCRHAVIFVADQLIGTGRLTPDGHIGRVAIAASFRRRGMGRRVMTLLEQEAVRLNFKRISLSAQTAAVPFYQAIGYKIAGASYIEATIEHLPMSKVLNS